MYFQKTNLRSRNNYEENQGNKPREKKRELKINMFEPMVPLGMRELATENVHQVIRVSLTVTTYVVEYPRVRKDFHFFNGKKYTHFTAQWSQCHVENNDVDEENYF